MARHRLIADLSRALDRIGEAEWRVRKGGPPHDPLTEHDIREAVFLVGAIAENARVAHMHMKEHQQRIAEQGS